MWDALRARARTLRLRTKLGLVRLLRSMAIHFDSDVSGSGNYTFGATRINYFLFHTTTVGPIPKPVSMMDFDHCLRIGWITFGVSVDIPGIGPIEYWRAPIWINFFDTEWSPIPQTDVSANDFGLWADTVRWGLSNGVEGHLLVSGV